MRNIWLDAIIKDMLSFIDTSPTAFHTVKNIEGALIDCGFTSLLESEKWNIEKGREILRKEKFLLDRCI